MYFRYKVNWNFDDKPRDETGLVYSGNEIDDTGFTEEEKQEAINKAYEKIDDIIDSMKF